jgi:hypothetical protein
MYYVYALCDPTKQKTIIIELNDIIYRFDCEPFYIGYGSKDRVSSHWKDVLRKTKKPLPNTYKYRKLKSLKNVNIKPLEAIVIDSLTKEDAKYYETELIRIIGRKDLNLGPLTNGTDGGDGAPNLNQESRDKMAWNRGKKWSEEDWEKIYGPKESFPLFINNKKSRVLRLINKYGWRKGINKEKEVRKKLRKKRKSGWTQEQRDRLSRILKGVPKPPRTLLHKLHLSEALQGKLIGEKNPMYQINFRDVRRDKFGEDQELILENNRRELIKSSLLEKKIKAKTLFPSLNYNGSMVALSEFEKSNSYEEAFRLGLKQQKEEAQRCKEARSKQAKDAFWIKAQQDESEAKTLLLECKLLLQIRKEKGKREPKEEVKDINDLLNKKRTLYRISKIGKLNEAINRYEITL